MPKSPTEIKESVTKSIIESLESNNTLWSKTWIPSLPASYATGKTYSGINFVILSIRGMNKGYKSNKWITYKECQKQGGNINKGEHGSMITHYNFYDKENKDTGEIEKIPVLEHYTVFNLQQTSLYQEVEVKELDDSLVNQDIEDIIKNSPCPILEAMQDRACYSSSLDRISMPLKKQFKTLHGYYSTILHEMSHSTGHVSRLDRKLGNKFGSESYSIEELIAEISTMYLLAKYGIDNKEIINNNNAYIKSWLRSLKNDSNFIFKASKEASKAFEYLDKLINPIAESTKELIAA